jgi:hypothetical protein
VSALRDLKSSVDGSRRQAMVHPSSGVFPSDQRRLTDKRPDNCPREGRASGVPGYSRVPARTQLLRVMLTSLTLADAQLRIE